MASNRYENDQSLLAELESKGYAVDLGTIRRFIAERDLHPPFDDHDVDDVVRTLPKSVRNPHLVKLRKVLASREWRDAVVLSRQSLGLPEEGMSAEEAERIHDALLESIAGRRKTLSTGHSRIPVAHFWMQVVYEARKLCSLLELDPEELDTYRISFSSGRVDMLLGVRKLLSPQQVFRIDGQTAGIHPSTGDRLIGHLIWRMPLSPIDLSKGPSIKYTWELMPDGTGRAYESTFQFEKASPTEVRELQKSLANVKRSVRRKSLLSYRSGGTWKERWEKWNRLQPDMAFPTADAMRKAVTRLRADNNG